MCLVSVRHFLQYFRPWLFIIYVSPQGNLLYLRRKKNRKKPTKKNCKMRIESQSVSGTQMKSICIPRLSNHWINMWLSIMWVSRFFFLHKRGSMETKIETMRLINVFYLSCCHVTFDERTQGCLCDILDINCCSVFNQFLFISKILRNRWWLYWIGSKNECEIYT